MKLKAIEKAADNFTSRPVRGAWIEIASSGTGAVHGAVAPREGRVD